MKKIKIDELNTAIQTLESSLYDLQLALGRLMINLVEGRTEFIFPLEIPYIHDGQPGVFLCSAVDINPDADQLVCLDDTGSEIIWGELTIDAQMEIVRSLVDVHVRDEKLHGGGNQGEVH